MTALIVKYLDLEKIKKIAFEKKYDEISYEEFIRFIDYVLTDDVQYDLEDDYESKILAYVDKYMNLFEAERKKGFSIEWAKIYAQRYFEEEPDNAPAYAYEAVKKLNSEQALTDLKLYSDLTKRDVFFVKHFAYLIEIDVPNATPSVETQAVEYSKIFKEELAKGSSEIFADKYADLMATKEYAKPDCYIEAAEYEKAISAGYSIEYSNTYALHIANYISNHFSTYEASIEDELVNMERAKLEKLYQHLK